MTQFAQFLFSFLGDGNLQVVKQDNELTVVGFCTGCTSVEITGMLGCNSISDVDVAIAGCFDGDGTDVCSGCDEASATERLENYSKWLKQEFYKKCLNPIEISCIFNKFIKIFKLVHRLPYLNSAPVLLPVQWLRLQQ